MCAVRVSACVRERYEYVSGVFEGIAGITPRHTFSRTSYGREDVDATAADGCIVAAKLSRSFEYDEDAFYPFTDLFLELHTCEHTLDVLCKRDRSHLLTPHDGVCNMCYIT